VKVLIIPEDQTQDGFIARPAIEALLADLGIPGRVDVLPEPRLRGAGDALDPDVVRDIVDTNPMTDLFVLVIDRDCDRQGHSTKAAAREREHPGRLVACVAVQELEVWMLALYRDRLGGARWPEVREDCDPKERWAEPLLKRIGTGGPGGGRKKAMQALKGQLQSLLSVCPELEELKQKLAKARTNEV
jgi:hypothetical protein